MSLLKSKTSDLLPQQRPETKNLNKNSQSFFATSNFWRGVKIVIGAIALVHVILIYLFQNWDTAQEPSFYANITSPQNICGNSPSHSGYIGLRGDSDRNPKRSFFWYFEAEQNAKNAPVILTIGGGPGTSGLLNPLSAQGPCVLVENGTDVNPNRWTEHFNLIALDHPVGVGFSYGTFVNNSRDAAIDAYDFLQKFYRLFPHLARNQLVLSGGSYGGMYIPHIATVINEQNTALAAGKGLPGAIHLNLESMMVSNPISDATSHFGWLLQSRCYNFDMYNASTCADMFEILPTCLDAIRMAQQEPVWSVEKRVTAHNICSQLEEGDTHGTVIEDVRRKCYSKDPLGCLPLSFGWATDFFHRADVKQTLGVPDHINFSVLNNDVSTEFRAYGDIIQPAYLLYGPLLRDGIRLLHYVGAQDANCAWPGIISFLKLLQSPFQEEFNRAPDVPWPTVEDATVRVVGEGAGNMTYILVAQAGHFVARDQPTLVKSIVDHWVPNTPFILS